MDTQQIIDLLNSDQPLVILQPTLILAPNEPGSISNTVLISGVGIAFINLPGPESATGPLLYSICQYASHAVKQENDLTGQAVQITDLTPRPGLN